MRGVFTLVVLAALVAVSAHAASGARTAATVAVYPSSVTIGPTSAPPPGATNAISIDAAVGETEDAVLLVAGAQQVSVGVQPLSGPVQVALRWGHYVNFSGRLIPDALEPWDGTAHAVEQHNQPLWLQFTVPPGTAPGTYIGSALVTADGAVTTIPITVKVFPVTLPAPNQVAGSLLTAFNVAGQSYSNKVASLGGPNGQTTSPQLYQFLASYRITPSSWGYGAPKATSGYTTDKRWWLDASGMMTAEVGQRAFAAMSIPISNNRTASANYIAGLSPSQPGTWCSYLQAVHGFWQDHDWLGSFPYLYGQDEPGLAGFKLVSQQAKVLHSCFPGGKELVTGNPSTDNKFLWNGGSDDADVWVVLANRWYGKYTNPAQVRAHKSNATEKLKLIQQARKHAQVWTYNYAGTKTPGFEATEPLSDPRLFIEWAALEHATGVLYGQGATTYDSGNPLQAVAKNGEFVLVYPSVDGPIPSARLEQIRDGIEDWEILNIVRQKDGAAAVGKILGGAGLFSTTPAGAVELGCTTGCALKTSTPFSWPKWSSDATTPGRLEQAHLAALTAAS
ncbi:MAG TPA: glycoside hydrolase domain-containing protein [Gaiellaceae bacterium]|nr:glycoside hydrolase domain-containing protein [Gaiellaceae bacterium]